jgi:hypothetical protein
MAHDVSWPAVGGFGRKNLLVVYMRQAKSIPAVLSASSQAAP